MPYASFGQKISFGNDIYCQLKAKGDKVHFRFLDKPYYDGKHFLKFSDGSFNVVDCNRINKNEECAECNHYYELMKQAKANPAEEKKLKEEAKAFRSKITFYFPILDRDKKLFRILQTTSGVRAKVESDIDDGIKVLEKDYVLTRTEEPGADYYKLNRLDSADTKPLDSVEQNEITKSKQVTLSELIGGKGKAEENTELEFQVITKKASDAKAEEIVVDDVPDDLPF